ncbi:uncharacterized protein TNCV_2810271 [Trichonephila clavipes]|nr:uncharacterized protein TNCV_2810271 [Trichonephila clavipes]
MRLERAFQEQSNGTSKSPYNQVKQCRERKRMNAAERINDGARTSAAEAVEIMQVDDEIASIYTPDYVTIECVWSSIMQTHWAEASAPFTTTLVNNPFGQDNSTDSIINRSDYTAISATWMEDSVPVNVPGFDLR